jgi:hypothetical protein
MQRREGRGGGQPKSKVKVKVKVKVERCREVRGGGAAVDSLMLF